MAAFEPAIAQVLGEEGGAFTDGTATPIVGRVPRGDPPTRWGITLPTLQSIRPGATAADVAALSREDAVGIYRAAWWERYGYGRIVDQQVATKVFSGSVNEGPGTEHHQLQRALRACGYTDLPDTGFFGPLTVKATNECEARELLLELGRQQAEHYAAWIAHDPAEREKDRVGLMRRAAWPYHPIALGLRSVA